MKKIILLLTLFICHFAGGANISNIELNRAIGLDLLPENNSWTAEQILKQMKRFRFQSSSTRHSSTVFRKDIFNVKLNEIAVNCAADKKSVTYIELIFANKGDTKKKTNQQITKANRILEKNLIKKFGRPINAHTGAGKLRKRIKLWKFTDCQLILDSKDEEYVMLILLPAKGESSTTSDVQKVDLAKLKSNVQTNDFGDHYISNIPMIDQGSKGYCVPATLARIFAFYGFSDLSMHKLADLGDTGKGGGTVAAKMTGSLRAICKQRNIRIERAEISVNGVAKYIDNGFPIVWYMFSSPRYETLRLKNTRERQKIKNPERWKRHLKKVKVSKLKKEGAHACLIIGYNKITGELAVSNSWGVKENVPSWIPVEAADAVSQGAGTVFIPKN